jgi:hypothetical protein
MAPEAGEAISLLSNVSKLLPFLLATLYEIEKRAGVLVSNM